jgi:hypothetical protein
MHAAAAATTPAEPLTNARDELLGAAALQGKREKKSKLRCAIVEDPKDIFFEKIHIPSLTR